MAPSGHLGDLFFFLVPYAVSGGFGELSHGLFEEVWGRLDFASFEPPPWTAIAALPVLGLYLLRLGRRAETFAVGPVAALLLFAATLGFVPRVYGAVWLSLRPLVPLVVLLGVWCLARLGDEDGERRQRLFLALAMTALWSVVQFPYAHGIYFCYVAPWLVLALTEVAAATPGAPRRLLAAVMLAASLFAVLWLNRGTSSFHGSFYVPAGNDAELALDRGGLRVPRQILDQLEEHGVEVVVLNWKPELSLGVERDLARALMERYPRSATVEPFTVHWR